MPPFFKKKTKPIQPVEPERLPRHIGVIMDGNGRWAKKRALNRLRGHKAGIEAVRETIRCASDLGVKYLTIYSFSTENWNRPDGEVAALMKLLESYLKNCIRTADKNNMRVRVIGDTSKLSEKFRRQIEELEAASAKNDGLNLQIAINYGSRDEMLRAMRGMYADIAAGVHTAEEIDEALFAGYLDTADIPDPDLLIRTSGEQRLSNYLLWQLAYSEFYFTKTPWPDFNESELKQAVDAYSARDRRYGKIKGEEDTDV